MTIVKPILLSAALVATLGVTVACSGSTQANAETAPSAVEAVTPVAFETAEFSVENMTCASCPITVRKAMERVPGVQSVEVDFKTKIATVEYDPALSSPADIAAAPTGNGYPATLIEG